MIERSVFPDNTRVCDDCVEQQFTELTFRSVDTEQQWKTDGYIYSLPRNEVTQAPNFFDPWRMWAMAPHGCDFVPVVRPEGLYNIAIKDTQVIWLARHDPELVPRVDLTSPAKIISSDFLARLARTTFDNADLYWTCSEPINGAPSLSDSNFRPIGRPTPEVSTFDLRNCFGDAERRGIAYLSPDQHVEYRWTLSKEMLLGRRLDDKNANAEYTRFMIEWVKG